MECQKKLKSTDPDTAPLHHELIHPSETSEPQLRTTSRGAVPTYGRLNSIPPFANTDPSKGKGKTAGIIGTSFNLLNTIIGAGIIGIPYAIKECGFVPGILLLMLVSYLTDKSLRMLVDSAWVVDIKNAKACKNIDESHDDNDNWRLQCGNQEDEIECTANNMSNPITSYEELMSRLFGIPGKRLMQVMIFIGSYGTMITYLIIIKDTIPTVLGSVGLTKDRLGLFGSRGVILVITSLLILVPLSMQRNLASLSVVSCISVSADIILVAFVAVRSPIRDSISAFPGGVGGVLWHNTGNAFDIFVGIGILTYALGCQGATFVIYQSLEDRSPGRWRIVTMIGVGFSSLLSAIMGVTGYLGFLDATKGDVLLNLDTDSVLANAARALLAITIILTYPMAAFVCRHVVLEMLEGYNNSNSCQNGEEGNCPDREEVDDVVNIQDCFEDENGKMMFCCSEDAGYLNLRTRLTLILYILALVPALAFDDLGFILSILGAVGGSIRNYIAPGMIHLAAHGDDFILYTSSLLANQHQQVHCGDNDDDDKEEGSVVEMSQIGHDHCQASGDESSNTDAKRRDLSCEMPEANPIPTQGIDECKSEDESLDCDDNEENSENHSKSRMKWTLHASSQGKYRKASQNKSETNLELPLEGVRRDLVTAHKNHQKPMWWYLLGFPIWCAVAREGIKNSGKDNFGLSTEPIQDTTASIDSKEENVACGQRTIDSGIISSERNKCSQKALASPIDHAIAIFFLLFGILAGTIGLGVNIYKEVAKCHGKD